MDTETAEVIVPVYIGKNVPVPAELAEWPADEDLYTLYPSCGRVYRDAIIGETGSAPVAFRVDVAADPIAEASRIVVAQWGSHHNHRGIGGLFGTRLRRDVSGRRRSLPPSSPPSFRQPSGSSKSHQPVRDRSRGFIHFAIQPV